MANSKITFSDKVALTDDVLVSEINKITDKNINEIKRVVNSNADDNNTQFNNVNNSINALQTSINNLGYKLMPVLYSTTSLSVSKGNSTSVSFPDDNTYPFCMIVFKLINSNRYGSYEYIQTQFDDRDYYNIVSVPFYDSSTEAVNTDAFIPIKISDKTAKIMKGNWWGPSGSIEIKVYKMEVVKK